MLKLHSELIRQRSKITTQSVNLQLVFSLYFIMLILAEKGLVHLSDLGILKLGREGNVSLEYAVHLTRRSPFHS